MYDLYINTTYFRPGIKLYLTVYFTFVINVALNHAIAIFCELLQLNFFYKLLYILVIIFYLSKYQRCGIKVANSHSMYMFNGSLSVLDQI